RADRGTAVRARVAKRPAARASGRRNTHGDRRSAVRLQRRRQQVGVRATLAVTLLSHHSERLETASAISTEVISSRGYFSVSSREELRGRGFPRDIGRVLPAIAIPVFALGPLEPGEVPTSTGLVLRPDALYMFKDGATAKYLSPAGQANG